MNNSTRTIKSSLSEAMPIINVAKLKVPKHTIPKTAIAIKDKVIQKPKVKRANMTAVLGGHFVPTRLYVDLMQYMRTRVHREKAGQLYTLPEMCEVAFWASLKSKWQKCQAGRAFAHMVYTDVSPFQFVQYKKYSTKRYLLK